MWYTTRHFSLAVVCCHKLLIALQNLHKENNALHTCDETSHYLIFQGIVNTIYQEAYSFHFVIQLIHSIQMDTITGERWSSYSTVRTLSMMKTFLAGRKLNDAVRLCLKDLLVWPRKLNKIKGKRGFCFGIFLFDYMYMDAWNPRRTPNVQSKTILQV